MATQTTEEAVAAVRRLFKETDARMERNFWRLEGLFGNQ